METRTLIDWISVTSHGKLKNGFRYDYPTLIGDTWIVKDKGLMGYNEMQEHFTGVIRLSSSKHKSMGVHTIYSGTTLKRLSVDKEIKAFDLVQFHVRNGANIARIDIAIDVFNSGLNITHLAEQFDIGDCETKARAGSVIAGKGENTGSTLYIGSTKKRKKLLRIYDKGAESGTEIDWIRIEYEVHGKPASQLCRMLMDAGNVPYMIKSIIKGYAHFPTNGIWCDVMKKVDGEKLVGSSETATDTRYWLLNTVASSLAKQVLLNDCFLDDFMLHVDEEMARLIGVS